MHNIWLLYSKWTLALPMLDNMKLRLQTSGELYVSNNKYGDNAKPRSYSRQMSRGPNLYLKTCFSKKSDQVRTITVTQLYAPGEQISGVPLGTARFLTNTVTCCLVMWHNKDDARFIGSDCEDVFRQLISQLVREICLEIYSAMNLDDILSRRVVGAHCSFNCSGLAADRWCLFVYAVITS